MPLPDISRYQWMQHPALRAAQAQTQELPVMTPVLTRRPLWMPDPRVVEYCRRLLWCLTRT